jgi:hypothetical protein
MNIRSQVMTREGLTITASDGRTYSVTRAQIRAQFVSGGGGAATRRTRTLQWLKDGVVAALGAAQCNPSLFTVNFEDADGSITDATWSQP